MRQAYMNFIRGVSSNGLSRTGVVLTTASFLSFCCLEVLRMVGLLTNAYIGLITYLAFPALFVLGLILIPYGLWRHARKRGKTIRELLTERFEPDEFAAADYGSKLVRTVALLTLLNVVVLLVAAFSSMHFMDQASFCGTACHSVMNPEWVTYQQSPHAKVRCVECHVGEGLKATFDAKLNGAYQILSLTLDLYEKPIPTPVRNLRPARETCEKCHWPDKFHGNRLETRIRYALDSSSTPHYTTLSMKIGSGEAGVERGSHWHISKRNEIRYASVDDKREEMLWVDVRQEDGSFRRYRNARLEVADEADKQSVRVMDCVDCHNRATHIYEEPDFALDERIRQGLLKLSLPYVKHESLATLMNSYSDI
ncbi:NapC/NirT family cytochrome c, partial [bacterium]|nr:NapC/NirT family cytochrome c [bacterium]